MASGHDLIQASKRGCVRYPQGITGTDVLSCKSAEVDLPNNCRQTNPSHSWKPLRLDWCFFFKLKGVVSMGGVCFDQNNNSAENSKKISTSLELPVNSPQKKSTTITRQPYRSYVKTNI